jgi:hypothetical protein
MKARWLRTLYCALALASVHPQLTAAQDDELGDLDEDLAPSEGNDPAEGEGDQAEPGAPGGDAEGEGEGEGETTEEAEHEHTGPGVRARAFFGGGFGTRELRRPIQGGVQRVEPLYFAAADVGVSVRIWPEDAFSLEFLIRYQTSLGLVLEERPLFALVNRVAVRSEHAELSVAPGFKLSDSPRGARLAFPIGASLRNFWPVEHQLLTPRYTLAGPHVRIELELPIGDAVRVRIGPEAQLFFAIGSDLVDFGVSSAGVALGGEAGVQFLISDHFRIELELRQSSALASSDNEPSFLDTERFVTARLAGEM